MNNRSMKLWSKEQEKDFFIEALGKFASPEQLFYRTADGKYYAYWPRNYKGTRATLQSRNTLIGNYTEKWCAELFTEIARKSGGYAVTNVVSEEIGLTKGSLVDVAICEAKYEK